MTEARPPSRRRAILVLIVTFALGIVGGLGLAPLLRPPPRGPLPPGLESLDLRPEQKVAIERILEAHAPEVDEVMADAMPRLRALQERVAVEIEGVLDEGQRDAFRRERERGRSRRPPPPP